MARNQKKQSSFAREAGSFAKTTIAIAFVELVTEVVATVGGITGTEAGVITIRRLEVAVTTTIEAKASLTASFAASFD